MSQISLECFLKRLVDNRWSDSVKPAVGRTTIINSGSSSLYLRNVDSGKKYPTAENYGSNNGLHSDCYMYEHATCFPFKYGMSFQDSLRFCTNNYKICKIWRASSWWFKLSKSSLCQIYPKMWLKEDLIFYTKTNQSLKLFCDFLVLNLKEKPRNISIKKYPTLMSWKGVSHRSLKW